MKYRFEYYKIGYTYITCQYYYYADNKRKIILASIFAAGYSFLIYLVNLVT